MAYHIFIASCAEVINTNLQRIIKNVEILNLKNVHIVIGGCEEESTEQRGYIELIKVKYRCFEFTPFIYLCKNADKYDFEYAFFSHDTVTFGPMFESLLLEKIDYLRKNQYDSIRIENNLPSMNIGIYTKLCILKNESTLMDLCLYTNNDVEMMNMKRKLQGYEDFIFHNSRCAPSNEVHASDIAVQLEYVKNHEYHECHKRYFAHFDFTKYQTNYFRICSINCPVIPEEI
jgi:hypothetical protein